MAYLGKLIITLALLAGLAFAQGAPPLTVQEADGVPKKAGVSKVIVSNGTLSISGTTATITTGGGGGSTPAGSTGDFQINDAGDFGAGVISQGSSGRLTVSPTLASSGVAPYLRIVTPVDTGQTTDTEFPGIVFGGNGSGSTVTRTGADGSTYALQREYIFTAPTYAFAGATTVTTAATVSITAAPIAGSNATLTNPRALNVESGTSFFNGDLLVGSANGRIWGISGLAAGHTVNFQYGGDSANSIVTTFGDKTIFRSFHGTDFFKGGEGITILSVGASGSASWFNGNLAVGSTTTNAAELYVVADSAGEPVIRADTANNPTQPIFEGRNLSTVVAQVWAPPWLVLAEATTNPTSTQLADGNHFSIYRKGDIFVIAYNAGGTITYLTIPLDGATTTWTQSTSAP